VTSSDWAGSRTDQPEHLARGPVVDRRVGVLVAARDPAQQGPELVGAGPGASVAAAGTGWRLPRAAGRPAR